MNTFNMILFRSEDQVSDTYKRQVSWGFKLVTGRRILSKTSINVRYGFNKQTCGT
jgi:hypothetical protein